MENQNLGKLAESAQYQAQLQKNLVFLAAVADAQQQTPTPTVASQAPQQSVLQQELHIQPPQPAVAQQQPSLFPKKPQPAAAQQQPSLLPPRSPFQFNPLQLSRDQQHLLLLQQQQQLTQGNMGMGQSGVNLSMHQAMQPGPGPLGSFGDARGGKQDLFRTGSGSQGNSASGHGSGCRDSHL